MTRQQDAGSCVTEPEWLSYGQLRGTWQMVQI